MLQCRIMLRKCLGGGFLRRTRWCSAFHRCSIGSRFGDQEGQGDVWTLWYCGNSWLAHATCGAALSSWNIPPLIFMCGMTWCCNISSRYLMPVSSPATCTRTVQPTPWHCHHPIGDPIPPSSGTAQSRGVKTLRNTPKQRAPILYYIVLYCIVLYCIVYRDYYQSVFGYRQYHVLGIQIVLCEPLASIIHYFLFPIHDTADTQRHEGNNLFII